MSFVNTAYNPYEYFTLCDHKGVPLKEDPFHGSSSDFKLWLQSLSTAKGCHWMIDTETVGLTDEAAIVQVGLAPFSPLGSGLYLHPYKSKEDEWVMSVIHNQVLNVKDQGRVQDPDTLKWWHEKNASNLHLLTSGTRLLKDELTALAHVLGFKAELWANSPTFDIDLLRNACKQQGVPLGLNFRNEWDVRTVSKLAGFGYGNKKGLYDKAAEYWARDKNAHDALNDVFTQIFEVQECYRILEIAQKVNK